MPFIARYRKEVTGELDEVQIRLVQVRVLSVDLQRKRIGLTMRSGTVEKKAPQSRPDGKPQSGAKPPRTESDLAAALKKSGFRVKQGKES